MNIQELITEQTNLVISRCKRLGMNAEQTIMAIHEDQRLIELNKHAIKNAMLNTNVSLYIDKTHHFGEDYPVEQPK